MLALGSVAHACSIPVFRYALDRWPADKFRLEVSTADAADEGVAKFLRNFTDSTPINIEIARVPEASRLVFPDAATAWTGALGPALATLTDSPARAEIVRRILSGENGVWVLVESGRRDADDAAAATLEKRLRYLEQVAQLPVIDPTDPTSKLGPGPALRVGFSLLRVPAGDAAEQTFVKLLAGAEDAPAAPWFALVFGRGRVLGAWPAEGFGDEQIDEACLFLLGACSCQVKRMNPGWDLLLTADWDEKLRAIGFPAVVGTAPAPAPPAIETVTIAAADPLPAAEPARPPRIPMLGVIALVILGCGFGWWMMRRSP
ncbi:MAG: hypothetical protein ABMA13_03575 [Chthoniobacteraceae bacterium]